MLNINKAFKEKGLNSKINNIALATDSLLSRILVNILVLKKVVTYYIIESIIYTRIISNNSSYLLYDPVLL